MGACIWSGETTFLCLAYFSFMCSVLYLLFNHYSTNTVLQRPAAVSSTIKISINLSIIIIPILELSIFSNLCHGKTSKGMRYQMP
jgi:hypothetical protein